MRWDAADQVLAHRTRGSLGALLPLSTLLGGCSAAAPVEDGTTRQAGREQQPTRCVGTLGAETVQGDLEVPRGRTCRLLGTAVDGRVRVGLGSTLHARYAVLGEGIGAHGFRRVVIEGGQVARRGPNFRLRGVRIPRERLRLRRRRQPPHRGR